MRGLGRCRLDECFDPDIAAEIAEEYEYNGYDDWYLPAQNELIAMCNTIGPGSAVLNNVGGFMGDLYWSSTEIDYAYANTVVFFGGTPCVTSASLKSDQPNGTFWRVRPTRTF